MNSNRDESSLFRVSVVIPTYNTAAHISRALDSVIRQTRPADEIIVVDDGSTDNTGAVVTRYGTKVRYIRQENAGASAARNTGIKAARSEWIAFLDADDEWLPQNLEMHLGLLERHRDLVWTTGNFIRCSCRQNKQQPDIDPEKAETLLNGKEYSNSFFQAYQDHLIGCTITMVIRKSALEEAGFFRVGLPRLNDYDMWFRLAYQNPKIGYSSNPSAIYHLDVPESIVKIQNESSVICNFLDRHLSLASDRGLLEEYRPCAAKTLGSWMRNLLWAGRGKEIRYLLKRYKDFYSQYFRVTTYISSLLPRAAVRYEKAKVFICGKI